MGGKTEGRKTSQEVFTVLQKKEDEALSEGRGRG